MVMIMNAILASIDYIADSVFYTESAVIDVLCDICKKTNLIKEWTTHEEVFTESFKFHDTDYVIMEGNLIKKMTASINSSIKGMKKQKISEDKSLIEIGPTIAITAGMTSAFANLGLALEILTGGVCAFKLIGYSGAKEFKDDVSFKISEKGNIRVTFPFYKIESIAKFNNNTDSDIDHIDDIKRLKKVSDQLEKVVTNQARISEQDFTLKTWDQYYNDTCDIMKHFSEVLTKISNGVTNKATLAENDIPKDLIEYVRKLNKQIPKDIKLITKFNEKIHKVFEIIRKPKKGAIDKLITKKFKFDEEALKDVLDIYKFDNKYLLESIRSFNTFYKNHEDHILDVNVGDLEHDKDFQHGLDCINKQFNANIHFILNKMPDATTAAAKMMRGSNITVGKQGFDLHGMKMIIGMDMTRQLQEMHERNTGHVFGQTCVSVLLHEIFHNIAFAAKIYRSPAERLFMHIMEPIALLQTDLDDLKLRISNFVKETFGIDLNHRFIGVIEDIFSRIFGALGQKNPEKSLRQICKDFAPPGAGFLMNRNTSKTDRNTFKYKREHGAKDIFNIIDLGIMLQLAPIIQTIMQAMALAVAAEINGLLFAWILFVMGVNTIGGYFQIKNENTNEETMCDMFAAMYQLPVHFRKSKGTEQMASGYARKRYSNMFNMFDPHAATHDRETVSYNLAKEMLNSGEKLAPEVKEYLQYIVDENDGINDVDRNFTKTQIKKSAPAFTQNINRAVNHFINEHPQFKRK